MYAQRRYAFCCSKRELAREQSGFTERNVDAKTGQVFDYKICSLKI